MEWEQIPLAMAQGDLGTRVHAGPLRVSANYFLNHLKDLITKAPGSYLGQTVVSGQIVRQNVNIDRARIQGVEATAEASLEGLGSQWTPLVTAAWQRGTNRSTGQPLPLIAPFVAQARLRWAPRAARAWSEWQARLVKGGGCIPVGDRPISAFTILAWRWGYEIGRGERGLGTVLPAGVSSINFHFGIENLTNRLYRGLFEPIPQPGREWRFGLDLNLDTSVR